MAHTNDSPYPYCCAVHFCGEFGHELDERAKVARCRHCDTNLEETMMGKPDRRMDVYMERGTRIWRASSFGACDGYLVRVACGQTPDEKPEWLTEKMNESAAHEPRVLQAVQARGFRFIDNALQLEEYGGVDNTGQVAAEFKVPRGVIRCHPDAIAQRFKSTVSGQEELGERFGVEVKAMREGASGAEAILAKSEFYRWQVSIEAASINLPMLFAVAWKDEDGKLVELEGGELKLDLLILRPGAGIPYSPRDIRQRAVKLNKLIDDFDEGAGWPACTWKQFPCGFWSEHDLDEGIWAKETYEVDEKKAARLRKLVGVWHLANLEGIDAEARKKAAAEEMRHMLEQEEIVGCVDVGEAQITRIVSPTTTLDKAAMKNDGIDVDRYMKPGKAKDYVKVKLIDDTKRED